MGTNAAVLARKSTVARIRILTLTVVAALFAAIVLAGCGGGGERQDANAPSGTWNVAVEQWKFPTRQPLGRPVTMKLVVRNIDTREIPSLVVTIGGLREPVDQAESATRTRPVWIVNEVRQGDQTPYKSLTKSAYDTGALAPGEARIFELPVTPLRRGEHVVTYKLAAGLFGDATLETVEGDPAAGSRSVAIDPTPDFDESAFD